jgi:hypothetical protein
MWCLLIDVVLNTSHVSVHVHVYVITNEHITLLTKQPAGPPEIYGIIRFPLQTGSVLCEQGEEDNEYICSLK